MKRLAKVTFHSGPVMAINRRMDREFNLELLAAQGIQAHLIDERCIRFSMENPSKGNADHRPVYVYSSGFSAVLWDDAKKMPKEEPKEFRAKNTKPPVDIGGKPRPAPPTRKKAPVKKKAKKKSA